MLTRRTLVSAVPALGAAAALAACAGKTSAQITQAIVDDAATIANGLANFVSNAQGIPPATVAVITDYAQKAVAAAKSLSTAMSQSDGQSVVAKIVADVNGVDTAVQGMVQAGSLAANILADVKLALPILETIVGLLTAAAASPALVSAMARLKALPAAKLN